MLNLIHQKEEVTASAPTTFFADFENEEVATTLFADFEEQEPGSEDLTQNEQTQTETNAHKLAAAGAQVDAVAKHTDAWTKELQNSVKNDNHKYAVFQGEKKRRFVCAVRRRRDNGAWRRRRYRSWTSSRSAASMCWSLQEV